MDQRDGLHAPNGGVDCAVCGRLVPLDGIRVLARREDISFVEIDCKACRSESLGIVVLADDGRSAASRPYGEFLPADDARFREAVPIDSDDVLTVHELLRRGGLRALVGGSDTTGAGSQT